MSSAWAVGSLALAVFIAILTFLGIVIWSIRRHRDPNLTLETECGIDDLLPSLAGLSLGSVVEGNSVEILENGAYFDVLFREIGEARRSVHFEPFLWEDGVLGRRMAHALSERAALGCPGARATRRASAASAIASSTTPTTC